ncbi:MAG: hypothetical protein HQM00_16125 [Magnetococcales bacterium]|nr:hypothetical protein [Magnetococcales bacterium]
MDREAQQTTGDHNSTEAASTAENTEAVEATCTVTSPAMQDADDGEQMPDEGDAPVTADGGFKILLRTARTVEVGEVMV